MFGLSNLQFGIALYVIIGIAFSIVMLLKYHQDKPWYTWTGHYTLTQAYVLGFLSVVGVMMTLWWWVSCIYVADVTKAIIRNWKNRNEHS